MAGLLTLVLAADRERQRLADDLLAVEMAADRDALTGIYNMRAWQRCHAQEETRFERYADPTAVVLIDLDGLKDVNDEQGHGAGDDYLCRAASALGNALDDRHMLARVGGDEFVVLLRQRSEDEAVGGSGGSRVRSRRLGHPARWGGRPSGC